MHALHRLAHRILMAGVSASLAAACSSAPSPSEGASPTAGASAAQIGIASPTLARTPAPSATPTATPKPGPLVVKWRRASDPATSTPGDWQAMHYPGPSWTKLGNLYVMALDAEDTPARLWISEDALHWRPVMVEPSATDSLSVAAVTTGSSGLIAIGQDQTTTPSKAFWTSANGTEWTRLSDASAVLTPGQLWLLGWTGQGIVTFGGGAVDVTRYLGPPLPAEDITAVAESAGSLIAFISKEDSGRPPEVWQSANAGWRQVGTVERANGAFIHRAVHGSLGWVALGCGTDCMAPAAWTSSNGTTWRPARTPPRGHIVALLADQSGFVAVGDRSTSTGGCVALEWEIFGETWTSSDGRTWRQMPEQPFFNRASIRMLLVRGRTLIGLGLTLPPEKAPKSTAWTAKLPEVSVSSATVPVQTPAPATGSSGCGE